MPRFIYQCSWPRHTNRVLEIQSHEAIECKDGVYLSVMLCFRKNPLGFSGKGILPKVSKKREGKCFIGLARNWLRLIQVTIGSNKSGVESGLVTP